MKLLTVIVDGIPVQQGTKNLYRRGDRTVLVDGGGNRHKQWRKQVAKATAIAAREQQLETPLTVPLKLICSFMFPMPASRPASVRKRQTAWKGTTPDLDKLLRSICDSLTDSGVIADDKLIVHVTACKVETTGLPGAVITLAEAGDWIAL